MEIRYTTHAFASLVQLINFIESKNTIGAGERWLTKYEAYIRKSFTTPMRKSICNNVTLKKLNLRCIYFKDWLIAFSIHENYILIEALFHKSRIRD